MPYYIGCRDSIGNAGMNERVMNNYEQDGKL